MKNESVAYVIGLSPHDLLEIKFRNLISASFDHLFSEVRQVRFGTWKLEEATIFQDEEEAVNVMHEIQKNYDSIYVKNYYMIESICGNDNFNPNDLHVYEVKCTITKVIK